LAIGKFLCRGRPIAEVAPVAGAVQIGAAPGFETERRRPRSRPAVVVMSALTREGLPSAQHEPR